MNYFSFCFLAIFLSFGSFNDTSPKNYLEVVNARFPGGENGFMTAIYQQIKYPLASRQNCEVGQVFVEMKVLESGEISDIQLMNQLSPLLDQEIIRALKSTQGKWLPNKDMDHFELSFGFEIGSAQEIEGDVTVTSSSSGTNDCESNEDYERKLKSALENKKYKRAKKICEELLRRAPRKVLYLDAYQWIQEEL